jgi:Zn-finger nucleic acid-binding protein
MKCISCQTEIDPKWKHAIDINVCPFCGQPIMEEHLKNLLATLGQTMQQMQHYPDQLNDWLLSNYDYIKTSSPDLKNYLPKEAIKELRKELDEAEFQERKTSVVKIKTPDGEEQEVVVEKAMSDTKTASFFDRAEVLKPSDKAKKDGPKSVAEKTQHLREMAQKVKREVASGFAQGGSASMLTQEMMADADPESVAEYQSMITGGDIVASAIPPSGGDDDGTTDRILAANMALATKKGKGATNEADLRALQNMYGRVQKAQEAFETGDNRGKNGFSRSG